MAERSDPLDLSSPIIDPETGLPTLYFRRQWLQGNLGSGSAQEQIDALRAILIGTGPASGLQGGGDLTANRDLSLTDTAVTPDVYGDATNVPRITVDQQGRITAIEDVEITGGGGGSPSVIVGLLSLHSTTATTSPLNWSVEVIDTLDMWDPLVNRQQVVIPEGVDFVQVHAQSQVGGSSLLIVRKNGSSWTIQDLLNTGGSDFPNLDTGLIDVVQGDIIDVTSSTALNSTGSVNRLSVIALNSANIGGGGGGSGLTSSQVLSRISVGV